MLSLVVPTYNERPALERLFPRLESMAQELSLPLEVVLVDDNSPDHTADFAQDFKTDHFHLRVIRREGKFGLASAVIEGWRTARGDYLGVIDGDGSHDESQIPGMVRTLLDGSAEVVVGSRYVEGGGTGDWPLSRRIASGCAVLLGRLVCPVRDLTSGFLLFRREVLDGVSLDPIGAKISLEVLVRGRYRTFREVPYLFRNRKSGRSKLGTMEVLAYLVQLGRLFAYRYRHPQQRRRWQRVVE